MHNHAGSRWLRASSGVLSHSLSCLLIAHVAPLCNSRLNPEKALYEGRFHSIIYRDYAHRTECHFLTRLTSLIAFCWGQNDARTAQSYQM